MSSVASGAPQYIRGVPYPLPDGERLLWEGAPSTLAVATHVFHWRLLAAYFGIMLAYWAFENTEPAGSQDWVVSFLVRLGLTAFVLATAFALAKTVASTTWYAITSQRVVLRIGMVFSMSINIPFKLLASAGVGQFSDGTGQVHLEIVKGHRLAYIALWPHCRVFRFNQPQPLLRGLMEPQRVGAILADAVTAASAADGASRIERSEELSRVVERQAVSQPAGA